MRGRVSGLGARISSTVGLFIVTRFEVHRSDYLLDEGYLTRGEGIFRVEVLVRPLAGPLLGWHKGVDLSRCVLRWLVQKNQEASQPTREVGQNAFGLTLGVKRANAEIRFRRNAPWLPDEWRTDDPVRVGISVAGPRSGPAHIDLPFVDEVSAS